MYLGCNYVEKSVEEEITDKMDENWAEIEKEIYTNFVTNV